MKCRKKKKQGKAKRRIFCNSTLLGKKKRKRPRTQAGQNQFARKDSQAQGEWGSVKKSATSRTKKAHGANAVLWGSLRRAERNTLAILSPQPRGTFEDWTENLFFAMGKNRFRRFFVETRKKETRADWKYPCPGTGKRENI